MENYPLSLRFNRTFTRWFVERPVDVWTTMFPAGIERCGSFPLPLSLPPAGQGRKFVRSLRTRFECVRFESKRSSASNTAPICNHFHHRKRLVRTIHCRWTPGSRSDPLGIRWSSTVADRLIRLGSRWVGREDRRGGDVIQEMHRGRSTREEAIEITGVGHGPPSIRSRTSHALHE